MNDPTLGQAAGEANLAMSSPPPERAKQIGAMIAAAGDEIESARRIPAKVHAQLVELGLLRLLLPRSAGGEEIHPSVYFHTITELARNDASIAWNVFVANSAAIIAGFVEPDVAREIFGDPAALVAWGPPNECRARATAKGYRVTGEWAFASGCRHATWMGVHAQVEEPNGELRLNARGVPTVRTLLFPAQRAELIDNWHTIGLRGTASDGYRLQDLDVTEAYSTTREAPDIRREQGPLYAIPMQGLYSVGVAGVATGIARAMLDEFMRLAKTKTPRGQSRLADNATIQAAVARAEAAISSASTWLDSVLAEIYANVSQTPVSSIDVDTRARVVLGSSNAIQSAIEVADTTYRLAGVSAIFAGTPLERRYRDIHTLSQQIQSRPGHFETVGRVMLGDPPAVFY